MPKFSESPFFVLKDFFTRQNSDGSYVLPIYGETRTSGCTLRGPKLGVSSLGGYGVNLYIKTSNGYYRLKGIYKVSSEDLDTTKFYSREDQQYVYEGVGKNNRFTFQMLTSDEAFKGSVFTIDQLFMAEDDKNYSGSEIYLKKGEPFYDYISSMGFNSFINDNKQFIYFGKLYRGENDNEIDIFTDHYKDYVYRALPEHNRSEKYDEFLGVAFDQLFQPVYNRIKNLFTLSDPWEVNEKYLMYMLESYNMPSLGDTSLDRRYVNRMVSLLKRKGAYTQLYLIWRLLSKTVNRLNIYERWHTPLNEGTVPYPYFEDHLYTENKWYNQNIISEGAGQRFYRTTYPCNIFGNFFYGIDVPYPVYGSEDYPYDISTVWCTLSAAAMDFDFTPDQDPWVIKHNRNNLFAIVQPWVSQELVRPAESVATNSLQHTITFGVPLSGTADVSFADYVHMQSSPSKTWTVTHNLDERYPVVFVMNRRYNQIIPAEIIVSDYNTITINFDTNEIEGYALIKRPNYTYYQNTSVSAWSFAHSLGPEIIVNIYDENDRQIAPYTISKTDTTVSVTFTDSKYHYGVASLVQIESKPHDWTLDHGIDSRYAMVQCWNTNLYNVYPGEYIDTVQLESLDSAGTHTTANFTEYAPGYIFAAEADYLHPVPSGATTWTINHNLGEQYVVVTVLNPSLQTLHPSAYTLKADNNNRCTITFSGTTSGYALIGKPDQVFVQSTPSASWNVEHFQYTDFNLITFYDATNDTSYLPTSSRHIKWSDKIFVEWSSSRAGFCAIKGAKGAEADLERVHNLDKVMSPHTRVEMDLSSEPLGRLSRQSYIVNKTFIDNLITLYEKVRPISRVYHYGLVIGTQTDFTTNTYDLYPIGNIRYATKCLITPVDSLAGCYVFYQPTLTKNINIFHGLVTRNVIIQCYDFDNKIVEPGSAEIVSENSIKVTFEKSFNGYVTVSRGDVKTTFSSPTTAWSASGTTYTSGDFEQIIQIMDNTESKMIPNSTSIVTNNPRILFTTPVSGYFMAVSAGKYNWTLQSDNTASIMHNLNGATFQVQIYNNSDELVYPDQIEAVNRDYINISFLSPYAPTGGYCLVKKISNETYKNTYTFNHVKLGYGDQSQNYNPITTNSLDEPYSESYPINHNDIDEDHEYYYLTINIDENIDYSVDEINNKYGIREIGIYNDSGNIMFYTYCGLIEKPVGVALKLYYKIKKIV